MIVKVNSEVPSWWVDPVQKDYPTIIHEWWDNLEWQDHVPPFEKMYFTGCNSDSLVKEMLCNVDELSWNLSELLKIDWLYKIAAHTGETMRKGFELEFQNIAELVNTWNLF